MKVGIGKFGGLLLERCNFFHLTRKKMAGKLILVDDSLFIWLLKQASLCCYTELLVGEIAHDCVCDNDIHIYLFFFFFLIIFYLHIQLFEILLYVL